MWLDFTIFLVACLVAGSTGGLFPPGAWYAGLAKPKWTPPNWVFPVTWTLLYLLMAFAGARLAAMPDAGTALALWSLQIALNALWTPVFFGLRNLRLGLLVLIGLWLSVAACLISLWQVDTLSGLLFLPYLAWVSVAGALNASVLNLNPEQRPISLNQISN